MSESLTLYKLIVLYMLHKVNNTLTNAQISDFILENEYTTYFTLQQAINELIESNLVKAEAFQSSSHYHITEEGENTLEYFGDRISDAIIADINEYLSKNKFEIINEIATVADYYKTTGKNYAVECRVREKTTDLIHLTLTVPTKEQATVICNNWKEQSQEIYSYLMEQLMK